MSSPSNKFCPLPWVHLSIEPDGRTHTCCNASSFEPLGHANQQNLESIWKSEKLSQIRQQMERGEVPEQCALCLREESAGGVSLRQASLQKYREVSAADKFPRYLGLRFDNTCQLACRICSPSFSTAWYSDFQSLGRDVPQGTVSSLSQESFEQLQNSRPETFYVAGGEPFLSRHFYNLLQAWIEANHLDVEILINTNFAFELGNNKTFALLKNFKHVYLDLSLDGVEEVFEYSRHPGKWDQVLKNLALIKRDAAHFHLKLFPTVSIFNLFHLQRLFQWAQDFGFSASDIRLNRLLDPEIFCLSNLPALYKKKALLELVSLREFLSSNFQDSHGLQAQLMSLKELLEADCGQYEAFLEEIELIDKTRNQSFFKVFPEFERQAFVGK